MRIHYASHCVRHQVFCPTNRWKVILYWNFDRGTWPFCDPWSARLEVLKCLAFAVSLPSYCVFHYPNIWHVFKWCLKARPQVADANRIHPVTRIAGPLPTSPSPPTPSSLRSASTTSSSTQSSPQQQQQTHHLPQQPPQTVATAASAPLTNGTGSNASSSMAGGGGSGGPPPPSRQSEPKDLKYRETPPTAKKKVTVNTHARKIAHASVRYRFRPAILSVLDVNIWICKSMLHVATV